MPSTKNCEVDLSSHHMPLYVDRSKVETEEPFQGGQKLRNLDGMLVQLCTLDRQLESKQHRERIAKTRRSERNSLKKQQDSKQRREQGDRERRSRTVVQRPAGRQAEDRTCAASPPCGSGEHSHDSQGVSAGDPHAKREERLTRTNGDKQPLPKLRVDGGHHQTPPNVVSAESNRPDASRHRGQMLSTGEENCCDHHSDATCSCRKCALNKQQRSKATLANSRQTLQSNNLQETPPSYGTDESNGFGKIEEDLQKMTQFVGMCPSSVGVDSPSSKMVYDSEFEEEFLRAEVASINIDDDEPVRFPPHELNYNRRSEESACAVKCGTLKASDEKTNTECRAPPEQNVTASAKLSEPRRSVAQSEKTGSPDIFGTKITDGRCDKGACGSTKRSGEATFGQTQLDDSGYSISSSACVNKSSSERALNSRSKDVNSDRIDTGNKQEKSDENCRVVFVKSPKTSLVSSQKSSTKGHSVFSGTRSKGSKSTQRDASKERRKQERREKRTKRSEKLTEKSKDSEGRNLPDLAKRQQRKGSQKDFSETFSGDADLKVPFERYIVGGDLTAIADSRPDTGREHKSDNVDLGKAPHRKMHGSSKAKTTGRQSVSDESMVKPRSKMMTKPHKKPSAEQLTAQEAGKASAKRTVRRRSSENVKSAVESGYEGSGKLWLAARRRKDAEGEKSIRHFAGKGVDKKRYNGTSVHQSAKVHQVRASNVNESWSGRHVTGNTAKSERVDRLANGMGKREEARIAEASKWHTKAQDAQTLVRPDRRGSRTKKTRHVDPGQGSRGYRRRGEKNRPPSSLSSTSSTGSSVSADSYYSQSSTSSFDSISSSAKSSSGDRRVERRYTRDQWWNSYKNAPAGRKPSRDAVTNRADRQTPNGDKYKTYKSWQQKSVSSTSSYHRRPIATEEPRHRRSDKRSDGRAKRGEADQKSLSPVDKTSELVFGAQRKKRPTATVRAEEDCYSTWQRHKLELVAAKPAPVGTRKVVDGSAHKAVQHVKSAGENFLKQTLLSNTGSETEKKPFTINDLYSFHVVLSDTQNGMVLAGYRRRDERRVAVKRITSEGTGRWGWLDGKVVPLELVLLRQVNEMRCHGVVEIVEWWKTADSYLLIMGRPHPAVDLYDYVSKHKHIKEPLAKHIVKQLVEALQHCIKCGVLHRDVKLENILLNPKTKDITLIDFGCGDYYRTTPYKEFAGTPEYYPPEWFLRKQYHGEPMTVWSIGVLLYSLLSGSLPFRSSKEITEKEVTKFPNDISSSCRDLLSSMLKKKPRERISLSDVPSHAWLATTNRNTITGLST